MVRKYPEELIFSEPVESTESNICVRVRAAWLPALSNPGRNIFAFVYVIDIDNLGEQSVQLVSRRWLITNAQQEQREVRGEGVVGQSPVLAPGQSFCYDSWAQLDTPVGQMSGYYSMREIDSGKFFSVSIPRFDLICSKSVN